MIYRTIFTEDSTAVNLARITGFQTSPDQEGEPLIQADLAEIKYWAYSDDDVVSGHNGVELDPAEVIFDELQGWSQDGTGHNFRHTVASTAFPTGGTIGSIIYRFVNQDGDVMHLEFKGRVRNLLSS